MKAEVLKGASKKEIETQERCNILEVANDSGDEFVSIARARVGIGVATALHSLRGVAERYIIISGVGRVELGRHDPIEVAEGDVVRIPPDTPQRIINIGAEDLVFYCICTPPFHPDCYQVLE
jgi:mannose-6-phosphate isomerase-like protein (cupin superfamily)